MSERYMTVEVDPDHEYWHDKHFSFPRGFECDHCGAEGTTGEADAICDECGRKTRLPIEIEVTETEWYERDDW